MAIRNFLGLKYKKERKYEAGTKGRRGAGWITGNGDANAQIKGDLPTLRERSRDLRRNNPYAHKIIEVITNNVVGKGISTDIKPKQVDDVWWDWASSTACDYDGRHDMKGLQRLIMDAVVEHKFLHLYNADRCVLLLLHLHIPPPVS